MIQLKCIQKFRDDSGKIYGYRLVDFNGQTQDVTPENLKNAILNGQVNVVNLTLTSDGRLVDTSEKSIKTEPILGKPPVAPVTPVAQHNEIRHEAAREEVNKPKTEKTSAEKFGLRGYINRMLNRGSNTNAQVNIPKPNAISNDENKYKGLDGLKRFACDYAEQHVMGKVVAKRYEDDVDEDGFAVYIANYNIPEYRYKILLDIAESGIVASMNVRDTKLSNYNRIEGKLDRKNLEVVLNYLNTAIKEQRLDEGVLRVENGQLV